jgi:cytochrome c
LKATIAPLALLAAIPGIAEGKDGQSDMAGERAYQKCYSCHALEAGRNDLSGPTLYAIVGRRIASEPFDYSPGLTLFAEANPVWTVVLLDQYVADPEALVPGTTMAFHGLSDAAERQALIDYLGRLGDQTKASAASRP